jgi:hypothetical protein
MVLDAANNFIKQKVSDVAAKCAALLERRKKGRDVFA